MAIPYDRKIIYSTYVIPEVIYTETLEEGTVKVHGSIFNVAEGGVGKALGAKSRFGECQTEHDQLTDAWTSAQAGTVWEDADYSNWEDYSFWLGGDATIDGPFQLRYGLDEGSAEPDIAFLFVKNTGDEDLKLTLDGTNYIILLPPFASFSSRINGITSANIKLDKVGSESSTAEYLIAI